MDLWREGILYTTRNAKSKDFKTEIKPTKMEKNHILFKIENDF